MMNGFKRAFWTSLHKKKEDDDHHQKPGSTRFGFFSNPSTPRSERTRPDAVTSSSTLRCQSLSSTAISSTPSPSSLHCKTSGNVTPTSGDLTPTRRTTRSPLSLLSLSSSTPSSPNFSILKSKLCFSKSTSSSRCGICLQSAKSGRGTAIFTAECSHIFHFSCVASSSGDRNLLSDCPVCGTSWRETEQSPKPVSESDSNSKIRKSLRVYNDDEPLITSPISPGGFNTIHEDEEDNGDFRGFPSPLKLTESGHVEVTLATDSAIVAVNKGHVTSTVTLKIKSPPLNAAIRSPVDLVTVLDVSGSKNIETVKKSMKILISSLRENDRLSMVSFSSSSKRLTPLKRMTGNGKRMARRIVEEINGGGDGMSVNDAVKKAVKVIEDRRQKNIFTAIFVLTDRNRNPAHQALPEFVSSTRVSYLDIAKHTIWVGGAFREDAFAKRVEGLLRFSVQDLTLKLGLVSGSGQGEITSVYSLSGRQDWFGSGLIRLSDMYGGEEREVLVELKSPASSSSSSRSHRIMTVHSRHVDPTTQEVKIAEDRALLIPRPIAVRSSTPTNIVRLRNRHVSTRAVAESRRLIEAGDYSGAERMLTSARALLVQYGLCSSDGGLRGLDYELANLNRMRGVYVAVKSPEPVVMKTEPLTPTSAWRAAERLAKVAIMRKHMNRVSDLHGFENARF